jgi:chromate transport protein ChrA
MVRLPGFHRFGCSETRSFFRPGALFHIFRIGAFICIGGVTLPSFFAIIGIVLLLGGSFQNSRVEKFFGGALVAAFAVMIPQIAKKLPRQIKPAGGHHIAFQKNQRYRGP